MLQKSSVDKQHKLNSAGQSSLVARKAHNLEVVGSNPTPAKMIQLGNIGKPLGATICQRFWVLQKTPSQGRGLLF